MRAVVASLVWIILVSVLYQVTDDGPDVQVKRVPVPGPTVTEKVVRPVPGPTVTTKVTKRVVVRKTVTAPAARSQTRGGSSRDLGRRAVQARGWSSEQWTCLDSLWARESGWRASADNPTSTAYGIAQFLDSTWAGTGITRTSDPARQIEAGLRYVKARYGTPCGAWSHSQSTGWY